MQASKLDHHTATVHNVPMLKGWNRAVDVYSVRVYLCVFTINLTVITVTHVFQIRVWVAFLNVYVYIAYCVCSPV